MCSGFEGWSWRHCREVAKRVHWSLELRWLRTKSYSRRSQHMATSSDAVMQ
jgi:hypothetical protein